MTDTVPVPRDALNRLAHLVAVNTPPNTPHPFTGKEWLVAARAVVEAADHPAPATDPWCQCGHRPGIHLRNQTRCQFGVASDNQCPCPAFTPAPPPVADKPVCCVVCDQPLTTHTRMPTDRAVTYLCPPAPEPVKNRAEVAWQRHVTSHPSDYYPSIPIGGWADIRSAFLAGFDAAADDGTKP